MYLSMKKDALYQLFTKRLHQFEDLSESSQDFIQRLAKEFFLKLTEAGHVPQTLRDTVLADIEDEVIEMYRKKTYGHSTLKAYRSQNTKSRVS